MAGRPKLWASLIYPRKTSEKQRQSPIQDEKETKGGLLLGFQSGPGELHLSRVQIN
jgi:hypothetical protein